MIFGELKCNYDITVFLLHLVQVVKVIFILVCIEVDLTGCKKIYPVVSLKINIP